mgnify:CR=1 FL=1
MAELDRFKGASEKKWIPPYGNTEGRLMLILSYPSSDACIAGDLSEGPHYEEIKNALAVAEIPEDEVYITTMVKYGIGNSPKPTTAQIAECHDLLDFEIKEVNPQLIITLGADPFKRIIQANKKVSDSLGEIVDSPYGKLLPNYSPGMIFGQDPKQRPFFREVFDLAKRFLEGNLNYTPYEYIVVDDPEVNKMIVQSYLDEGKLMIGYDAEWRGEKFTDDEVMYTFQYSCEPHKAIILDISKDGVAENQELLETMRPLLCHPDAKRMGWNIRADDKRLAVRGLRPPDSTLWFDGMKACAFFDSRWSKGLETGIRKFTNYEPYYNAFNRAMEAQKVKKHDMSKLKLIPETQQVFYHYCGGDAVAHREACINMRARLEKELTPAQQKYFFEVYLPLTHYFLDLELAGIPIDQAVMEDVTLKYKTKYDELKARVLALIKPYGFDDELMGDMEAKEAAKKGIYPTFNPNSPQQKKILLFEILGLTPAYYTKAGKSAKPKVWYLKQKPQTQRLYSPSTNGKSLATIKFELAQEIEKADRDQDVLQDKYEIVSLLLSLTRVGVFSEKFFSKQGTDFANEETETEYDEDDEPKKSSYWAALCADGKLHPDFFECLNNFRSSSRVNVQNPASKVLSHIPEIFVPGHSAMSKDEQKKVAHLIPRNIRHVFCTGDPDWYWAEVDVAGADLAIAAFCSKDPEYIHDILKGNFHLKKAREYFKDDSITKDDYSKYVSAKSITFRVAYTSELQSAAIPIQAEIYAESGIFIELPLIEYALSTWERYVKYMAFREQCKGQVKENQCIDNLRGFKYRFEESENFSITAGWQNESLAYPIASELALFLWDVSVKIKERMVKEGLWMHKIKPVNSVHDASYWLVHKDLMQDNYFPELCRHYFTKKCTITTGDNLGMEMVVSDRWKGKDVVFHNETEWNFDKKIWQWKVKK